MHHQEKKLINAHHHHLVDSSQQEHLNFAAQQQHRGSMSPVSTASVAGDSQRQTITSLANAGYRGKYAANNSTASLRAQQLPTQNEDIERDSISNSDAATRDLNIISRNELHSRSKKLSWQHEDFQVSVRYCSEEIIVCTGCWIIIELIFCFIHRETSCEVPSISTAIPMRII